MTEPYVVTRLVDCNRINSPQYNATTNGDNNAEWINNIGDGLILEPGDEVSVQNSFISELACGNEDVIETTGGIIGQQVVNYTELTYPSTDGPFPLLSNSLPNLYYSRTCQNIDETITLKDNELNLVVSYYKNANGEQYIHLPRRFGEETGAAGNEWWRANYYRNADSFANGRPYLNPENFLVCSDDYKYGMTPIYGVTAKIDGETGGAGAIGYSWAASVNGDGILPASNRGGIDKKMLHTNKNDRYTIFMMSRTYWNSNGVDFGTKFPAAGQRDIALEDYIQYKEKKTYNVTSGFNSPANIGTQLTSQLNNTNEPVIKKYKFGEITADEQNYFNEEISLSVESDTYRLFDAANWHSFNKTNYTSYMIDDGVGADAILYYNSYATIGVKRPDLFLAFRELQKASVVSPNIFDPFTDSWYQVTGYISLHFLTPGYFSPEDLNSTQNDEIDYPFSQEKELLLTTNIPWNNTNLDAINKVFNIQRNYPELFNDFYKQGISAGSTLDDGNFRFIHMDMEFNMATGILGNDKYENTGGEQPSMPLFVYCNDSRRNTFTHGTEPTDDGLCYGWAYQYVDKNTGVPYISFALKNTFFGGSGVPTNYNRSQIYGAVPADWGPGALPTPKNRKIGFDWHFNAYGTSCILPYTGKMRTEVDNRWFGVTYTWNGLVAGTPDSTWAMPTDVSWTFRHIYIGSMNPLINFDSDTSRFQISQLHTSEVDGDEYGTGAPSDTHVSFRTGWTGEIVPPTSATTTQVTKVYKINKRIKPYLYTPDMMPYFTEIPYPTNSGSLSGGSLANTSNADGYYQVPGTLTGHSNSSTNDKNFRYMSNAFNYNVPNYNISKWVVFDSECGIFIEDFCVSEDTTPDSLIGIMGYDWDQLNMTETTTKTGNNQTQLSKITENTIKPITTNALITPQDVKNFNQNQWGIIEYDNPSQPIPMTINQFNADGYAGGESATAPYQGQNKPVLCPEIKVTQVSAVFPANKLARKMTSPYYLIETNLISDAFYNGNQSGNPAQIIAVVNRENGFGDYYFAQSSNVNFTITKRTPISSIVTRILNPKLELARLDSDSAIIYKIQRNMKNNLDIVDTILNKKQKEDLLGMPKI